MNDRISIDLPRFYSQINELRQSQGLGRIETGIIAIQANLRFAVVQRRNLNLKNNSIDLTKDEAEVLCEVVEELFKVRPSLKNIGFSNDLELSASYELPLKRLYDAIHEQRMIEKRVPVETAVIAVRLGVKFLIMRRRVLDFKGELLLLDAEDIQALEQILLEQFAVRLPSGLANLCNLLQPSSNELSKQLEEIGTSISKPIEGWMSRILKNFAGYGGVRQRLYRMDFSALLSHIAQQRAAKGFRYVQPSEMQRRYNERLTLELQLKKTQDPKTLVLNEKQLETVTHVIYKELDVIIPNVKLFTIKA